MRATVPSTARRVWQRLVEEHGAEVGETTVRPYVAVVRAHHELPLAEVAVPQTHSFGAGDVSARLDSSRSRGAAKRYGDGRAGRA
jgi:hypothetical protein